MMILLNVIIKPKLTFVTIKNEKNFNLKNL